MLLIVGLVPLVTGCGLVHSPTAPSETWRLTVPAWSPYIVIQPNNAALDGYQQALGQLTAHGAVHGARINLHADGSAAPTVRLASTFGLEIVGIMDDDDLFKPDVVAVFDQYAAMYPEVKIFQVGNEITMLTDRAPMTLDRYLDVLQSVYTRVRDRYPDVTLVSQSTFGSGTSGADELAAMAPRLAAMGIPPERLVIGINVYTETALAAYAAVLASNPTSYRIWVTETGVSDPTREAVYVNTTYPQLRLLLYAERIYWYALWAGDAGGDSGFSLITSPTHPPIMTSPLFQLLTRS